MLKSKYFYRTNKTIVLTQFKLNNNSTFLLHSSQINRLSQLSVASILIALTMSCHTIFSIMCRRTILQ